MFCKMANFELQTRVPMMIRAPWLNTRGSTTAVSHSLVLPTEFGANSNMAGRCLFSAQLDSDLVLRFAASRWWSWWTCEFNTSRVDSSQLTIDISFLWAYHSLYGCVSI